MTSIQQRILYGVLIGVSALALAVVVVIVMRSTVETRLQRESDLLGVQRLWDLAVRKEANSLRKSVAREVAGSGFGSAGIADRLAQQRVERVTFFDALAQPVSVVPPTAAPIPMDDRRISQLLSGKAGFHEVRIDDRQGRLVIAGALPEPVGPATVFVASAGLEGVLADVVRTAGQSGFVVDPSGKAIASRGVQPWETFEAAFRARDGNVFSFDMGVQRVQGVGLPLRNAQRGNMGHVVILRDVTLAARWLDVLDVMSISVIVIACLGVIAIMRWFVGRILGPLGGAIGAMSLLSRGDTSVEVLGTGRQDEMGEMARSIAVFRDRARQLRDSEDQRRRQWSRQQEFIRIQMLAMADTLPPEGREAFLEDLRRIEERAESAGGESGDRALAHALEVMTERVSRQHRRLDDLVQELQAALNTKTELFQLQQEVEVARGMQRSMLPRGLLPRPELEVGGRLVPAEEFDGGFYDYFWIDGDRLAVTLGQPAKGGLGGGYQSATARASLRALLSAGLAPGASLARTSELLSGEEEAEDYAMACAVLDPARGTLTWSASGVAAPFLVRRLGDAVQFSPAATGSGGGGAKDAGDGAEGAEIRHEVPRRASVVLLSPGVVLPDVSGGRDRVLGVLRGADDTSVDGLMGVLRREGVTDGAAGGNVRDRLCVIVRFTS